MSNKKVLSFSTALFLMLFMVAPVFAASPSPAGFVDQSQFGFQGASVRSIPNTIFNGLHIIAALLGVGYLMWGGIRYITSRGDRLAVEAAKKQIVAAIIGVIVVAASFFILSNVFKLAGSNNPLESGCFKDVNGVCIDGE